MRFIRSILYALEGIRNAVNYEKNFRIQFLIVLLLLPTGILLRLSGTEWIFILICCAMVLSFEIINSAIEKICNFIYPDQHPAIKQIKDMSAGAVLISTIISVIIGLIIFVPKLLDGAFP